MVVMAGWCARTVVAVVVVAVRDQKVRNWFENSSPRADTDASCSMGLEWRVAYQGGWSIFHHRWWLLRKQGNNVVRSLEGYVDTWWSRDGSNWHRVDYEEGRQRSRYSTNE